MSAGAAGARPGPGAPRTRHRTREGLFGVGEGDRRHGDRPLTQAIQRPHGLAVKKRAEGYASCTSPSRARLA